MASYQTKASGHWLNMYQYPPYPLQYDHGGLKGKGSKSREGGGGSDGDEEEGGEAPAAATKGKGKPGRTGRRPYMTQ